MDPISQKALDTITEAGKEAVSLVVNKTTGDNHPEYEKALISGTAEAIKELAKSDTSTAVRIYESMKVEREKRDFFNFSKVLLEFSNLIKIRPKEKIKDDNDFFWNTIEYSKDVSNEEMQTLIAKIIAGEYNVPGTYSMSTLQTIKMLGKNELELFEKICGLLIYENQIPRELFRLPDSAKDLMQELGIDFGSLQLLQSLGLFLPNEMMTLVQNPKKDNFKFEYFSRSLLFIPENGKYSKIDLPSSYGLSAVGGQILKHLNPKYNEKYFIWLRDNYKIPNYKITE